MAGIQSRYDNVDLIVVRENTEGLYSGLEHIVIPGVVESLRIITEKASARIARFAFDTARRQGRKRVTCVHKANILKLSDGLFLDTCRQVATEYHDIAFDDCIVDAAAMKLVLNPHNFDVLVMENLFGDILSDLASGLVGGLGVTPSANIGEEAAVFEAVHGTAPDIAGKGLANPTALILSGVLMLRYLREREAADRVENAVRQVIADGHTPPRPRRQSQHRPVRRRHHRRDGQRVVLCPTSDSEWLGSQRCGAPRELTHNVSFLGAYLPGSTPTTPSQLLAVIIQASYVNSLLPATRQKLWPSRKPPILVPGEEFPPSRPKLTGGRNGTEVATCNTSACTIGFKPCSPRFSSASVRASLLHRKM